MSNRVCLLSLVFSWALFTVGAGPVEASPVILMDGFLVDSLEDRDGVQPDTDIAPRRSLENMFRSPPEMLRLDLPPPSDVRGTTDDEVMRRQRAAEMHFRDRRWESALREYQQLMRLQPGHLPYIERGAVVATLAGRYASADAYFYDVVRMKPEDPNYWAAWANVLIRLVRFDDADEKLEEALSLDPDHLMARHLQLILQVVKGRPVDFEYWEHRPLRQILEVTEWLAADADEWQRVLGPDSFRHVVRTALADLPVDRLSEFHRTLRRAVPYLGRKEWQSAYAILTEAQALGANLPLLQMERIRCLIEAGDAQEALLMAESLMADRASSPDLAYGYGFILIKAGEYKRAVDILMELAREVPDRPDVQFALACALAGEGRLDVGWPILEKLAQGHPDRFPSWMDGDAPYLIAIRSDPRYQNLSRTPSR